MEILLLITLILFGAGAVVGAVRGDWATALVAAGLFAYVLDGSGLVK